MYEVNYLFLSVNTWDAKCFLEQIRYTAVLIHNHQREIALMLLGILLLPSSPHSFTFSETDFITHSPFLTNLSSTPSLVLRRWPISQKKKTNRLPHLSPCIRMHLIFSPVQQRWLPSSSIKPISTIFESIHSTAQESHTIYHSAFFFWIFNILVILHISFKLQFF